MAEQTPAEKKAADTFKAGWQGGFDRMTVSVGGKVIKVLKPGGKEVKT
jgi:hypothetical protein